MENIEQKIREEAEYCIGFENMVVPLKFNPYKEEIIDVDFFGSMMIQFENHDGLFMAINAMDGGYNCAGKVKGKKAIIYYASTLYEQRIKELERELTAWKNTALSYMPSK